MSFFSAGVTVCLMSVFGVKPGEMGDSIMISRLEKDSVPVTLHIPTSKQQVGVISLSLTECIFRMLKLFSKGM